MSKNQSESFAPDSRSFLSMNSGRWATQALKKALMEGRELSSKALRTLDTLRHEDWKYFDDVVLEEAQIRLVGVADLLGRGLTKPVPNALGKMVFAYEKINVMDDASVSLDGLSRTTNDRLEYTLSQAPLPIIHKDYFLNIRTLAASRNTGEPLDSTQARAAARVVAEKQEDLLFNGYAGKFGGLGIYGYTTFPDRNQDTFDGGKTWDDPTKAGTSYLADVLNAIQTLAGKRQYGPFVIYVPTAAGVNIENDFNPGTSDTRTIRQRILQTTQIADIRVADKMPAGEVVFVQMDPNNVLWVTGEPLQNVQWDEGGGFTVNFKVWTISMPLIRSDQEGRSGIFHLSS